MHDARQIRKPHRGQVAARAIIVGTGSLISARLAMELGRAAFGAPPCDPGAALSTEPMVKQGAIACGEDVIAELPTPVRAALDQGGTPIDEIVERTGLHS